MHAKLLRRAGITFANMSMAAKVATASVLFILIVGTALLLEQRRLAQQAASVTG